MAQKSFFEDTSNLMQFLSELVENPNVRKIYISDPEKMMAQKGLDGLSELSLTGGLFHRFVSDEDAWDCLLSGNHDDLDAIIGDRFPALDRDKKHAGPIVLNNVLLVNDAIAGSQSLILALSTLKAVAVATGVERQEVRL